MNFIFFSALKLQIQGIAHASWSESEPIGYRNDRNTQSTVTYTGHEDYISTRIFLIGSGDGQQMEIPSGVHTYNFQCCLPLGIPTSFEGSNGHIRYTVKAILDRPWQFDQISKVAFTVIRQVDLNHEHPSLNLPIQMEVMERFCCWPCQSAPLILTAQIPMSGYVPGQIIIITVDLNNRSSVSVYAIHISLRKTVVYHAEYPSHRKKKQTFNVTETKPTAVKFGSCTKFNKALEIPPVVPTNQTENKIIHQTYEVIVEARVSGCHSGVVIHLPVTFGTIPLHQQHELPRATAPESECQPSLCATATAPPLGQHWQGTREYPVH
jgi:Arrestin (or S-antigen), N-terminal domain/Arrestin (or S-antigen), C-terminal domain